MNQKNTALVLLAVLAVALLSTLTVLPDLSEKAYATSGHHSGHHGGGGHSHP
jgi:hypothetical protein